MTKEVQKRDSRGRTAQGGPNPVDIHVGNRIRLRRTLLGMSQETLAALLGLTFQQIQKYERGTNRVSASRLWDISNVLETPVNFFFEEMNSDVANQSPRALYGAETTDSSLREHKPEFISDPMQREETIELVRAYYRINNRKAAKHLYDLIIALSKTNYLPFDESEEN